MPAPSSNPNPKRSGPPRNPGVRDLIESKTQWHYRPDPEAAERGFRGWHERGYLPHFDAPDVTQFVTFMLHDSFPIDRLLEWEPILDESDESERRRKLERWLDRGAGECWLSRPAIASQVEEVLLAGNGKRFQLRAWSIMPNHVHLVVDVWDVPLSVLVKGWKGRSAREGNLFLGRRGSFWDRDYFDKLVENSALLPRFVAYTENNPVKAKFVRQASDWKWSSARWRDEMGLLPWQKEKAAE